MFAFVLALLLSGSPLAQEPSQQAKGEPPVSLGARDIFVAYKLPSLKDHPGDSVWASEKTTQVLTRAVHLGLNAHSATDAWATAETTYAAERARAALPPQGDPLLFRGARASQLNVVLAHSGIGAVKVVSPSLVIDTPIRITGNHVSLDLALTHLVINAPFAEPYVIRVENARDVEVADGTLTGARWGILVANSKGVRVHGMSIRDMSGGGVVVTGSDDVDVLNNDLRRLGAAPILLHGSTHRAVVADNTITGNLGSSNWHAGVVVTDRSADLARDAASLLLPDNYWVKSQPIIERLVVPEDNVIAFNQIAGNASSGIYSDGSARNVILGNRLERNAKEGLCLDNGSTANLVAYNLIQQNGKRWGKTDQDLQRDFVLGAGRLPDGTSAAKVPGISMDNSAYNQVLFNEINENFGGGIKMVRTDFYNLIGINTITDNNEGASAVFHFFGIEVGAAKADAPASELDFTPSRGNELFSNMIRGTHYAGIFFADGSDGNDIFDNTILGATNWAMESTRLEANKSLNNLTNLKLRNIQSGLDPGLLTTGAGQFDH